MDRSGSLPIPHRYDFTALQEILAHRRYRMITRNRLCPCCPTGRRWFMKIERREWVRTVGEDAAPALLTLLEAGDVAFDPVEEQVNPVYREYTDELPEEDYREVVVPSCTDVGTVRVSEPGNASATRPGSVTNPGVRHPPRPCPSRSPSRPGRRQP
ncbi:hypothetical protein ACVDFE_31050 [Lentzea chajnantorensis]